MGLVRCCKDNCCSRTHPGGPHHLSSLFDRQYLLPSLAATLPCRPHADTGRAHTAGGRKVCCCSRGGGLPAQHEPGRRLWRGASRQLTFAPFASGTWRAAAGLCRCPAAVRSAVGSSASAPAHVGPCHVGGMQTLAGCPASASALLQAFRDNDRIQVQDPALADHLWQARACRRWKTFAAGPGDGRMQRSSRAKQAADMNVLAACVPPTSTPAAPPVKFNHALKLACLPAVPHLASATLQATGLSQLVGDLRDEDGAAVGLNPNIR